MLHFVAIESLGRVIGTVMLLQIRGAEIVHQPEVIGVMELV